MLVFSLVGFAGCFVLVFAIFFAADCAAFDVGFLLRWAGIGTSLQDGEHEGGTDNLIGKFLLLSND